MRLKGISNPPLEMEAMGAHSIVVGTFRYQPARIAQRVRRLALRMWGDSLLPGTLEQRIYFDVMDPRTHAWARDVDGGNFSGADGASVILGKWDEDVTVGIALHELAHEVHYRDGRGTYNDSDWVVREALALLAEREAGLQRSFEREPYCTASTFVAQLSMLRAFTRQPFKQRWDELIKITDSIDLADMVNYYLDRSETLGFGRWMSQFSPREDTREQLLRALALCSFTYDLPARRLLLRSITRCHPDITLARLLNVIDAIVEAGRRFPDDSPERIIEFCFAPLPRSPRRRLAFG